MHLTPAELDDIPAETVERWLTYVAAENEAQRKAQERACKPGRG